MSEIESLRAEVAALRETIRVRGEVQRYYREKLAEARALLAGALRENADLFIERNEARALLDPPDFCTCGKRDCPDTAALREHQAKVRAFLRRDEAPACVCGYCIPGKAFCVERAKRDEARRCEHDWRIADSVIWQCQKCHVTSNTDPARDEARR